MTDDLSPVFSYRYDGAAPVSFADLTPFGVGWVEHGDDVIVPIPIVHHELVPLDEATAVATAAQVAVMYPELVPVEEPPPYPEGGAIADVLEWVADDPFKAAEALTIEQAGRNRVGAVEALTALVAGDSDQDASDHAGLTGETQE